jgi:hypothetical protein
VLAFPVLAFPVLAFPVLAFRGYYRPRILLLRGDDRRLVFAFPVPAFRDDHRRDPTLTLARTPVQLPPPALVPRC